MKRTHTTEPSPDEAQVLMMEENLAAAEKALLVLAHSVQRWRTLVDEIKAANGWQWTVPAPSALFGDAVLFKEYDLRVIPRSQGGTDAAT